MVESASRKKLITAATIVVIVFALFIMLFLPIIQITYEEIEPRQKMERYWEKEPYQITKDYNQLLINYIYAVPAGHYIYYTVYIEVSGKEKNIVTGNVFETAGYDINFYVFDQRGFNAWKEGKTALPFVSAERVRSYSYSFVPDHSDYYYFVLDNRYSWFTNKLPQITAWWSYQMTITEYRDVEKTRTIIEYVKVTKTKYVSIFEILTRTN